MADLYQNKINQYLGDVARSAKFAILLNPPKGIELNISLTNNAKSKATLTDSDMNSAIEYFCYAGAFPGITSEPLDFKFHGKTIPIPGVSNPNQTWTATFYNDELHGIRKLFKDWIENAQMWLHQDDTEYGSSTRNSMLNTSNPYDNFVNSYIAIWQYDYKLKNKTAVYALFNAFPVSMSDVEVSYENINQVQTFTVEFRYTHFDMAYVEGQASSASDIESLVKNTINTLKDTAINTVKSTLKSLGSQLYESANKNLGIDEFVQKQKENAATFLSEAKGFFTGIFK